jgi:hypothetical protein
MSTFPTITVEIAFATAPLAVTPTWTDVTAYVRSIPQIRRGRQNPLTGIEAGTAIVVLDNRDRRFDPTYASGAYYPNVLPGKKIRVSATWAGVTYRLFTGYIDTWPPAWEASNQNSTVTITCTDAFKFFNLAMHTGSVAAEYSNWAINTMLTNIGFPVADRSLSNGTTLIASATLTNANVLQRLLDIATAEGTGLFFVRGDGFAIFQDRQWRFTNASAVTSQATFGDSGVELPYQTLNPAYDDTQLYNDIHVTASGGTEQVSSDATSQTAYFKRTLTKTGLLIGDASGIGGNTIDVEAAALASYLLYIYKDPVLRFDSMTLLGNYSDNLWIQMLARDLSHHILVKRRPPPSGSTVISQDCYIESIEHRITDITATYLHWETTWQLSPVNTAGYWILEDATYGLLDSTTRLAY